jgi:DNA-directed RNA polymerase subunit RPC12/RpoP
MQDDDFFDFMVLYELLFPDDEDKTFRCLYCGREIKGSEKVEWIDKDKKFFKCPDCDEQLKIE